jgi:hypothetical protein
MISRFRIFSCIVVVLAVAAAFGASTANAATDAGSGPWRYMRTSYWSPDLAAVGASGYRCVNDRCTYTDAHGRPIHVTHVPVKLDETWERWSDGHSELGLRPGNRYATHCVDAPSPHPSCLGNHALFLAGKTAAEFPVGIRAGRAELRRLIGIRNAGVLHAAHRHGFVASELSPVEAGIWLLSDPVYDATSRARIARVLITWPGTHLVGPARDHLHRAGTQYAIPTFRRSVGSRQVVQRSAYRAVFADGQLLQYTQLDGSPRPAGMAAGFILFEERSRQETPTPHIAGG